jgi:hypothetical protein
VECLGKPGGSGHGLNGTCQLLDGAAFHALVASRPFVFRRRRVMAAKTNAIPFSKLNSSNQAGHGRRTRRKRPGRA